MWKKYLNDIKNSCITKKTKNELLYDYEGPEIEK